MKTRSKYRKKQRLTRKKKVIKNEDINVVGIMMETLYQIKN